MARQFDTKSQEGLQEVFNTMSQNGRLGGPDLASAIRAAGPALTQSEIQRVAPTDTSVDYAGFVQIMARLATSDSNSEAEVIEAFKVFDKDGDGLIPGAELRHILMTLGEKMNALEVDELFREANLQDNGQLNYEDFSRLMFSQQ
ncbi:calmodulin-like 3 [Coemansia sp. RSA 1807]|nr:calmodulin-like 3 [Coemansia sp. RSA 1752]KAJ1781792.1 calmodulin-like 3 [Coemansia sp. RSA 1938]KAJ2577299.1 calmodulin-like 3 [Coemansia sp. RSA 1807]